MRTSVRKRSWSSPFGARTMKLPPIPLPTYNNRVEAQIAACKKCAHYNGRVNYKTLQSFAIRCDDRGDVVNPGLMSPCKKNTPKEHYLNFPVRC